MAVSLVDPSFEGGGSPTRAPAMTAAPRIDAAQARAAAQALVPVLAERAAHAERLRRCPDETIADLHRTGLLRLLQPARWGGSELGLDTLFEVVMTLARGCASTAWTYSNLASHNWNIGQFDARAQADVWGDDPQACAATGLAFPCGKAAPVEGGYRLTGRWPFGSGVDASTWMLVGALVEQGQGAPGRRFFLVPRADFRSFDNWQSLGLCATGSHDVAITDAFVPAHRTMDAEVFATGRGTPGAALSTNPLYAMPTFAAFAYVLCTIPVGAARGAVEGFVGTIRARAGTYTGVRLAELAPVQARIAEASACVEFAETVIRRDWQALEDGVRAGQYPDLATKLRWKRNAAFATSLAVRAVDTLMPAAGAGGLDLNGALQRQFRDIHAASSHFALTWDVHAAAYGQNVLGLPPQPGLLL